jgi:hypothetical protein
MAKGKIFIYFFGGCPGIYSLKIGYLVHQYRVLLRLGKVVGAPACCK